jgi:hypothetical protein
LLLVTCPALPSNFELRLSMPRNSNYPKHSYTDGFAGLSVLAVNPEKPLLLATIVYLVSLCESARETHLRQRLGVWHIHFSYSDASIVDMSLSKECRLNFLKFYLQTPLMSILE